jgi:hypothetical protein
MTAQLALATLPAHQSWTPVALGMRLGTGFCAAQRHLQQLVRAGLARPCLVVAYQLTPEGVMAAKERRHITRTPRKQRSVSPLRQRAWQAARMLEKFTVADVLELAVQATENGRSAERITRDYLNNLSRAGILRRMRSGRTPKARYFLLRDLGPMAPVWRKRQREVLDRNSGRIIPCARKAQGVAA